MVNVNKKLVYHSLFYFIFLPFLSSSFLLYYIFFYYYNRHYDFENYYKLLQLYKSFNYCAIKMLKIR